ncbi:MAG: hypothetical protein AM325_006925 [Candidatus Thorarchaeota archaeon SMTZ1-45]|nr:MAG: hypothetical protein AM325_08665 [Candidatus Thorarchaeota archaeon SMTZ1-45]
MENELLLEAKALYKDRIRIALSAFIILFSIAFFIYYTTGIAGLGTIPRGLPGVSQGLEVVAAFNNVGLLVAVALMVLVFRFWSWAFLPGPASLFTTSVLRGILGPNVIIKQFIGKRFEVTLDTGQIFNVNCHIQEKGTDDWFSYRLVSSKLQNGDLKNVALRHGFSFKNDRFIASISNDELHHRTLLMAKALMIAGGYV